MHREHYLEELERRVGREPDYYNNMQSEGGPNIGLAGFDHYPRKGDFTYFSHGLHLLAKPQWIAGRPEYFISIDNDNRGFGLFFAYLLSAFAPEKVMGWNTLIGAGDEDAVEGHPYRRMALGPPVYLDWPSYRIDEPGQLPINLGMAYFISDDDFETAAATGFGYLEQRMQEEPDYWRKIKKRSRFRFF
jgi:hypothetical protein